MFHVLQPRERLGGESGGYPKPWHPGGIHGILGGGLDPRNSQNNEKKVTSWWQLKDLGWNFLFRYLGKK